LKREQEDKVIRVKNRDIIKLQRVVSLMQDIRALEDRRGWQKDRMTNITQHLSFAPGGRTPQGLDAAYASLSELEGKHRQKVKAYARELRATERILNSIENPNMRTFVVMMYVLNLTHREVRAELNMSEWGFRRAKEAVEQAKSMERVVWRERYIFDNQD
jgi:hypothetical protein